MHTKLNESNQILAIDFGKGELRLGLFEGIPDKPHLAAWVVLPWGSECSEAQMSEELRPALASFKTAHMPPAAVTWGEGMTYRLLTLPEMPEGDLKKALALELEEKFGVKSPESLVGSETVAVIEGADGSKERLLSVFHCDRKEALARLNPLTAAGLGIVSLLPGQAAVGAAVGKTTAGEDILVCDIGWDTARLLIVRAGKILFSRSVPLGGNALTEMLTAPYEDNGRTVQLDRVQAEELKIREGADNPQASHIGLVRSYLEKIVTESKRSVSYYESQKYSKPVSKVVFTGGGSNLKGLREFMTSFLGMEILADSHDPGNSNSKMTAAALGAAIADPASGLNLLPMEIRHAGQERTKKASYRFLFLGIVTILAFSIALDFFKVQAASSQLRAADVYWKEIGRLTALLDDIRGKEAVVRDALKGDVRHPGFLKMLSRDVLPGIVLEEIVFERKEASLVILGRVEAEDRNRVKVLTRFVENLLQSPFFKEATIAETRKEAGAMRFEIRCAVLGLW